MRHTQDEVIIVKEIAAPGAIFRLEEFWEEDDSGFCCVDYVLAKHTRVTVTDPETGVLKKIFDFDSREYDKSMEQEGQVVVVIYHPEFDQEKVCRIDMDTLEQMD